MLTSSVQSPSKGVTLESIRCHLDQWRSQRLKGSRIPKPLWQDIASITTVQNYEGIAAVLNISPQRLRKEADLLPSEKAPDQKSPFPFAEVSTISFAKDPFKHRKEPSSQNTGVLEITRANGTLVKVSGLDKGTLVSLLQQL